MAMSIGHAIRSVTLGMPKLVTGGVPKFRAGDQRLSYNEFDVPESLSVSSDAFNSGEPIPVKYTGDGENVSPPLRWSGMPADAKSFVLIVEDPDAPTPNPFVHWLAYNIPTDILQLHEAIPKGPEPQEGAPFPQGKNSMLQPGYAGPSPPKGDIPHHYHFQLYALDRMLDLAPGAGRSALLKAMRGHVLAKGRLIGTYGRKK
ncbi:MAG: Phosphatidylethanolamine-binding protein [Phycisphaerales bacterium]|jgi:Raf kinase inhibitor-like YbhB/YbcL family protein|nr:Phosphatidylethanolamine-binding protein [Phycisphaerales bacterium]